jgi:Putative Actinobacterial Holin-X, holin superfamily III
MSTPMPPPGTTGPVAPSQPDVGAASVGELLGNVTRDLSTLMRQELALAQAELRQEATKTGKAAGAFGGAGVAGFLVLLFLSLALWAGLSEVMHPGWAALIVAVLWAIAAAVLYATGRTKLREVHPKPERTVDTLSSVPDALRGHRGGTTP